MLTAYLAYNQYRVAEQRLELKDRHAARDWADNQYIKGISVFLGRYSVKYARWRWVKYIPGVQTDRCEIGKAQPVPYRAVKKATPRCKHYHNTY